MKPGLSKHTQLLRITGWVIATGLLIYCLSQINPAQVRAAISLMRWPWIILALLANATILLFWAGLWWSVTPGAERPAYSTMFEVNAVASALMNTVPFLGGHAAALVLLVKRAALSPQSALSVMALDQLGEGLAKLTIFAVVAISAPIPSWMRVGIGTACVGVAILLVVLLLAAHGHAHLPWKLLSNWAARLEALRSVRQSIVALAFAIGTKLAEGAGLLAVQYAFGIDLSVGSTALVLAAVVLGSILPVVPGNVGTYEAGAFLAYRHLGVEPGMAAILAVTGHLCFLVPSVGIGYAVGSGRLLADARS
jgi:glycosyltransferase AglD